MANHGPLCKRIKNDKENILKFNHVEQTVNIKWCVSKVPQYSLQFKLWYLLVIVNEYDQEIPQSQTADNPVAPRGRAA